MSWVTNLFSSGADKLVSSVGNVIDSLVTSDEERLKIKQEVEKQVLDFKLEQLQHLENHEQELTERLRLDTSSDSWLSKNIRPLTLIFLIASTVILAYLTIFILEPEEIVLVNPWLSLLQALDVTALAFYFGGRSFEKVKR